jgi:arabinofuranan 3-O-arabinosyltransferase
MQMKFWTGALSPVLRISKAEDLIFTERRLSLFAYALFVAQAAAFALRFVAAKWMIDKAGNPTYLDFLQWWLGGQFALRRDAAGAYNFSTFSAAQTLLAKSTPPAFYFHWVYPPTMFLLVAPLARLPYVVAFFAWIAATFGLCAAALYAIVPFLLTIVLAFLPLPAVKNVFDGQTAFLTAGLLGLSMVFMSRRPYLSGMCLGILTYKPQFIIFFPLTLLITGQWRVIAGATASASVFAGAAALAFGSNTWQLFLHSLQSRPAALFPPNQAALNQTVFGLMHEAGAGVTAAWVVHLGVALLITAFACQVWTRPVPHSLKAAAFSIGALMATPYMLAYDLAALSVPTAFLVADSLAHGFGPGERLVLTGCYLALFLCFNFAVGPIVLLALMGLVVKRVRHATNATATIGRGAQQ